MEKKDKLISNIRLKSQRITTSEFNNATELVSYMGALQAQDYAMAKWAIGVRLQKPSLQKIESSLDKGEIIRTHILRPTWHFVAADDIYWMLGLTAPRIKASMKSRHNHLELTESMLAKTVDIIENEFSKGKNLTRNELAEEFTRAGIRTDENRLSHILFMAELEAIICSGPVKNNKQTYSLLRHRVPKNKRIYQEMNHLQNWQNAISQAAVRLQYRTLPGGQTLHLLKSEKPWILSNPIFIQKQSVPDNIFFHDHYPLM